MISGVGTLRHLRPRPGAIVSVAVTVAVVTWLLAEGSPSSALPAPGTSVNASPARLKALQAAAGRPVYWLGSRPGAHVEVSDDARGSVYVRYLPPGTPATATAVPTVGTYPVPHALAALDRAAARSGARKEELAGGALAMWSGPAATSVYLAWPGRDEQVEVYDPVPGRALALVRSGGVRTAG